MSYYSDIDCPYCGEGFELNTDDGAHMSDGGSEQEECPHCEKRFMVTASCTWSWEGEKADCLNGEPHSFMPWHKLYEGTDDKKGQALKRRHCIDCNNTEMGWFPMEQTS